MKYITMKDEDGIETLFMFPRELNHDAVAEMLGGIKNQTHGRWQRIFREPVSAGFVDEGAGRCYGRSESLGMSSRKEDSELLKKQMQGV